MRIEIRRETNQMKERRNFRKRGIEKVRRRDKGEVEEKEKA